MLDGLQFNKELIELIYKHYPKAIKGDIEQNSRCASALAVAMGGVLAFAFRMNGEVIARTVLQTIIKRIVENAEAIDEKAGAVIRKAIPTILH